MHLGSDQFDKFAAVTQQISDRLPRSKGFR